MIYPCGCKIEDGLTLNYCGGPPGHRHNPRYMPGREPSLDPIEDAITEALLLEYPWHSHDQWVGEEAPEDSWPHLSHVVAVAAEAVLKAIQSLSVEDRMKMANLKATVVDSKSS